MVLLQVARLEEVSSRIESHLQLPAELTRISHINNNPFTWDAWNSNSTATNENGAVAKDGSHFAVA